MEIALPCGRSVIVDAQDYGDLIQFRWYSSKEKAAKKYVYRLRESRSIETIHRRIIQPPHGLLIDHINGDTFDNRRSNLRVCTTAENLRNRRVIRSSTGFKGVSKSGKSYAARICLDYKDIFLGNYRTAEEAAAAYDLAAIKYFGEFAATNAMILSGDDCARGAA